MIKTIVREIGIVIMLLLAVVLVLAIIFYDYVPNNKTVPIKIQAYNIPEDVEQELKEAIPTEQNIVRTYYIDSSDLNLYESTNDYDKGKANPFAYYVTEEQTNSTNQTVNNNTANSSSSNENNKQTENEVYITTPGKNY